MATAPDIDVWRENGVVSLVPSGDWVIERTAELRRGLDQRLREVGAVAEVVCRGERLGRLDTSGAWMLQQAVARLRAHGASVSWDGFTPDRWQFLQHLAPVAEQAVPAPRRTGPLDRLEALGRATAGGGSHLVGALAFLGQLTLTLLHTLLHPGRLRVAATVAAMQRAGVNALPIVALMAFLISIVIAYQGATQLARFGAEIFTVNLTTVSLLREMGVLLTAVLVAGRSGSAFAAEIGVMRVNQELDAMQTIGMDPFEVLVLPRVLALVVMLPLLTMLANLAGLAGGALSAHLLIQISPEQYLIQVRASLTDTTFWVGIVKAPVFGFLIATAGTFWGLRVRGSAESVGRLTTVAVVQSIFMVIAADAAFSVLFARWDW